MSLSASDFAFVQRSLASRVGISLTDDKEYLVVNRLSPLLRRHNIDSLDRLVLRLRMEPENPIWDEIVDALTTNETSFFRDEAPFRVLSRSILPTIFANAADSKRNISFWSAGCSSGQEAYSLAMLTMESAPEVMDRLQIVGSDVSTSMLRRARDGCYGKVEISRGLSDARRNMFFTERNRAWEVRDELKRVVRWEKFNLTDEWPTMPLFDLVLLRNVMVYFDLEVRGSVLGRVRKIMRRGGIVMLGSAESMMLIDESFEAVSEGGITYYVAI